MHLFELNEQRKITPIVFYGGRFQPMHHGHYKLYSTLVDQFGKSNVYIATMFGKKQAEMFAVSDYSTDPFTFNEKKQIMHTMFGIPSGHVINTQPYQPSIEATGRSANDVALVLAFSEKDFGRVAAFGSNITELPRDFSNMHLEPASTGKVYYVMMPSNHDNMSATQLRDTMKSDKPMKEKQSLFTKFFGKFDQKIFNFIHKRMQNSIK